MRRNTAAPAARTAPMARPMGRGAFLRGVGAAAVAGVAAMATTRRVAAQPDLSNIVVDSMGDYTVYPTGTAQDLDNLRLVFGPQGAAPGTTVTLKATLKDSASPAAFNLGPSSDTSTNWVPIDKNVTILGEALQRHPTGGWVTQGTTVLGGRYAFLIGSAASCSVTVKDIIFDGFYGSAICFSKADTYSEVSGCDFRNPSFGFAPSMTHAGLWSIMFLGYDGPFNRSGQANILNNHLEGPPANMFGFLNNLMIHVGISNLDLLIQGNTVDDAYWGAIVVYSNMGTTQILNNTVNKTKAHLVCSSGISVGVGNVPAVYQGSAVISGNVVNVSSYGPAMYGPYGHDGDTGIAVNAFAESNTPADVTTIVSNNIVNMGGMTLAGLASVGASKSTTWEHNTVTGTASYGLLSRSLVNIIGAFNTVGAPSNNRFANNDLKGFKASIAQAGLRQSWNVNYAIVSPSSTTLTNNNYGELAAGGKAGAVIDGSGHKLTNENFWGVYPGLVIPPESSQPCLYLTENSSNVTVTALKNGQVINGITVCNQIVDMNVEMSGATTNLIAGIEKCDRIDYQSLQVLKDRIEGAHQAPPDLSQVDLSNLPPSYP